MEDLGSLGFFVDELEPATAATARRIARSIIGPYLEVGGGAAAASQVGHNTAQNNTATLRLVRPR